MRAYAIKGNWAICDDCDDESRIEIDHETDLGDKYEYQLCPSCSERLLRELTEALAAYRRGVFKEVPEDVREELENSDED